ncbi:MAG: tetratricopeptide repeat protein, partial [Fibrobacterota bacterium]
MLVRFFIIVVAIFFATPFSLRSETISIDSANALLLETRDKIYNFDNNDSIISKNLSQCRLSFQDIVEKKERLFLLAKVQYFEGLFSLKKRQVDLSEKHFTSCIALLTTLTRECGEFSDAYSLIADSYIQIMLHKNIAYQMINGAKLKTLPEKAIRLDSGNTKAYQSLAVYCMNAPQALGGNIPKAIVMLSSLSSRDKGEMFNIYYLLGNAYMKLSNSKLAIKYLRLAHSIY